MRKGTVIKSISYGVQTEFTATGNNTKVAVYEKIKDTTRFKLIQMVTLLMEVNTSFRLQILIFIVTTREYNSQGSC